MIRYLIAASAGLTALNTFLLGYPGDVIPQVVMIVIGGASVVLGATTAVLVGSVTLAQLRGLKPPAP
jgi:hypothetical protein